MSDIGNINNIDKMFKALEELEGTTDKSLLNSVMKIDNPYKQEVNDILTRNKYNSSRYKSSEQVKINGETYNIYIVDEDENIKNNLLNLHKDDDKKITLHKLKNLEKEAKQKQDKITKERLDPFERQVKRQNNKLAKEKQQLEKETAVSYTHLTLPTILRV